MKVTNTSTAPQGLHTEKGVVYIKPGATMEVELSPAAQKGASRLTFLKLEGDAQKAKADPEDAEKAALIAQLKSFGIEAGGNSKLETLQKKLQDAQEAQRQGQ